MKTFSQDFFQVFNYQHYVFELTQSSELKDKLIDYEEANNSQLKNSYIEDIIFFSGDISPDSIEYTVFLQYLASFPEYFFSEPQIIQKYFQKEKAFNFFIEENGFKSLGIYHVWEIGRGKITRESLVSKIEFDSIIKPNLKFQLVQKAIFDRSYYQIAYNMDYFFHESWFENMLIGFNTIPDFVRGNKLNNLEDAEKKIISDLFYLTHHTDFSNSRLKLSAVELEKINDKLECQVTDLICKLDYQTGCFAFFKGNTPPTITKEITKALTILNNAFDKPIYIINNKE